RVERCHGGRVTMRDGCDDEFPIVNSGNWMTGSSRLIDHPGGAFPQCSTGYAASFAASTIRAAVSICAAQEECAEISGCFGGDPAGIRTQNQRIKSPVLC